MLQRAIGKDLKQTPLIFAGVTYPVEVGLVSSLQGRDDPRPLAGVKYGYGVEGNATVIGRVFPDKQLVYVYQRGIMQDAIGARKLKAHPLYRAGRVRIVATEHLPRLSDMRERDCVYFSWLTAERILESMEGQRILRERVFVAASRPYVTTPGLAPLGVAADDVLVGQLAARVILSNSEDGVPLGRMDIPVAPTRFWINSSTAQAKGIRFAEDVLAEAAECYE
jgi:ABC-type uncharacterized transport system substrate-binding protein